MNKKGFTLTELLASITILALISTIAGFTYTKIMKDNKIKQCEQKILYIEKQAIKFVADNPEFLRNDNDIKISIGIAIDNYLIPNGYLLNDSENPEESDIINPLTNKKFSEGKLNITKNNGLINAKYLKGENGEYECAE